jgi:hypothetical protein
VRGAVIFVAVAYFTFIGIGIYLMADGQTGAGETMLIAAMAGGWFGSRWVAQRARERDES